MCGGELHGEEIEVRGVTVDSRSCAYGADVMFAAMLAQTATRTNMWPRCTTAV